MRPWIAYYGNTLLSCFHQLQPNVRVMSVQQTIATKGYLQQQGYLHLGAGSLWQQLSPKAALATFKASWNALPMDRYLQDSGTYRYRRYSVFQQNNGKIIQLPTEPHYQSIHYNHVHGGIYRHYSDILPEVIYPVLEQIMAWNIALITPGTSRNWRIQCHQFRIVASKAEVGKPSPEGIHQDGADYVSILLLERKNVRGGCNTIYNEAGDLLYRTTLRQTGELILINDKKVWHGVSPVEAEDKTREAYRDVLVMTFHAPR